MRFGELASAMTDISESMLAVRLKNQESHNLISESQMNCSLNLNFS